MVRPFVDIVVRIVPILDTFAGALVTLFAVILIPALLAMGFDIAVAVFIVVTLAAAAGNGETFLFGGVHRLKMLLLVDGESRLCRGESDPRDGDEICDVLDALFMVRRINVADAFFCIGISMFVLLLVTFRVVCNDVVRLNGIRDVNVLVFFGDVGSETITGISPPADGSSLMNVP